MWWWWIGCGPQLEVRPAPPPCAHDELPSSLVVESSLLSRGRTRATRTRFELVTDPALCTDIGCRLVLPERFEEMSSLSREALALHQRAPERAGSPHTMSETLRVSWGEHACERRSNRRAVVSDPRVFRRVIDGLRSAWRAGAPLPSDEPPTVAPKPSSPG